MQERVLLKTSGGSSGRATMLTIQRWIARAGLLACVLSLFVSTSAWADARVVVRAFKGPKGTQLRAVVIKELNDLGVEVIANTEVDRVARAHGVRVDEPSGRREVSSELTIHAWIDGRVTRADGGLTAAITVQEGTGEQVAELTTTRRQSAQLVAVVRREFRTTAGPAIEKARAAEPWSPSDNAGLTEPSPQHDAAVAPPPPSPELPSNLAWPADVNVQLKGSPDGEARMAPEQTAEAKKERKLSVFEAAVSLNTLTRTLRLRDAFALGAADYELAAAPLVTGAARFYPGALSKATVACCIGIDGSIQRAFGLGSQSKEGVTYKTKFEGYTGALVGRIPFAQHEINLLAGYGLQRFLIAKSAGRSPAAPSVDYRQLRLGGGGRFAWGSRTKLGFDAHWLMILSTGQPGSAGRFPSSAGSGFEGALYVDVNLFGGVAARARGSYQRSVFALAPPPGSQGIEATAVDTYITAGLGLSYAY